MTLPQKTIDRINKDSIETIKLGGLIRTVAKREGYVIGATAEATRAMEREKVLVDALKASKYAIRWLYSQLRGTEGFSFIENDANKMCENAVNEIESALTNYAGEGEVGNG
jgi:hypothetical protein